MTEPTKKPVLAVGNVAGRQIRPARAGDLKLTIHPSLMTKLSSHLDITYLTWVILCLYVAGMAGVALGGLLFTFRNKGAILSVVTATTARQVRLTEDVLVSDRPFKQEGSIALGRLLDRVVVVADSKFREGENVLVPRTSVGRWNRRLFTRNVLFFGAQYVEPHGFAFDVARSRWAKIFEGDRKGRITRQITRIWPWMDTDLIHQHVGTLGQPNGVSVAKKGERSHNPENDRQSDLPPIWIRVPLRVIAGWTLLACGFCSLIWFGVDSRGHWVRWLCSGLIIGGLLLGGPWW